MSFFKKILFSFIFIVVSGTGNAALVTVEGKTVSFTYDNALTTLFGAPIIDGNSLLFLPTNFKAQSLDGGATALTSDSFQLKIDALDGHHITNLALTETGDYILDGQGATVSAFGELRAVDLKAPFIESISKIELASPFVQTGIEQTGDWAATANLAFVPNTITSLSVSIENILLAQTGINHEVDDDDIKHDSKDDDDNVHNIAFIEKKYVGLTVTAVPLPTAVWLFGAGLMGLLSVSKRRKLL